MHWTEPEFLSYSANVSPGRRWRKPAVGRERSRRRQVPCSAGSASCTRTRSLPTTGHRICCWVSPRGTSTAAGPSRPRLLPRDDYRASPRQESPREGTAVTDGMFIASRDREHFSVWPESFLRPGCARATAGSTATHTRTGDWSKRNRPSTMRRRSCRSTSPSGRCRRPAAWCGATRCGSMGSSRWPRRWSAASWLPSRCVQRRDAVRERLDVGRRIRPRRNPERRRPAAARLRAGRLPRSLRRRFAAPGDLEGQSRSWDPPSGKPVRLRFEVKDGGLVFVPVPEIDARPANAIHEPHLRS